MEWSGTKRMPQGADSRIEILTWSPVARMSLMLMLVLSLVWSLVCSSDNASRLRIELSQAAKQPCCNT